ncbi:MAG TPA: very short patch repair endonuclease [Mucilaginibacter sp.]|nr:very short patch repair endonuclease [Mucilaginibacter sp.]
MTRIKSANTKSEIRLRKALFAKGVRFRLHNKFLFGNPDIAIRKYKLAIFIDGEFWHGYNWAKKKDKISANRDYWIPKIEKNIARDILVNKHYENSGWTIFRFWEKDINRDLENCIDKITRYLDSQNI